MTRKLNAMLLAVLLIAGLPFAWLMLDSTTRDDAAKPITIAQLRGLAGSLPGAEPIEVRYENIGLRHSIGDLLAAGSGLRAVPNVIRSYELIRPEGGIVLIDRGMIRIAAQRERIVDFDPVAQAFVDRASSTARLKLLLSGAAPRGGSKAMATDQYGARKGAPGRPYAVAPGIVVVPVDGVAQGESMIYVRLRDDGELLFAGDVAPLHASWQQQRPPARFVTTFLADRDREEIARWLRTIAALKAAAPDLHIVPGSDSAIPRILIKGFIHGDGGTPRNG